MTFGPDFVRDFIVYSEGKAVSRDSIVLSKHPFCERILRIFNFHSEFRNLSGQKQMELLMINGSAGIILIVARIELVQVSKLFSFVADD